MAALLGRCMRTPVRANFLIATVVLLVLSVRMPYLFCLVDLQTTFLVESIVLCTIAVCNCFVGKDWEIVHAPTHLAQPMQHFTTA